MNTKHRWKTPAGKLAVAAFILGAILPPSSFARAAEERTAPQTIYGKFDLAKALDAFQDREYFEHVYVMARAGDNLPADLRDRFTEERFILAVLFHYGIGVKADPALAAHWYATARDEGYMFAGLGGEAETALAELNASGLYDPENPPPPSPASALEQDTRFRGPEGLFRLHELFASGLYAPLDFEKADHYLDEAAAAGHLAACKQIAWRYYAGHPDYAEDQAKAVTLLTPFADTDEGARMMLIKIYGEGADAVRDPEKALALLQPDVDAGKPEALLERGKILQTRGSIGEALALFEKAGDLGSEQALYLLVNIYRDGINVAKDEAKSDQYYQRIRNGWGKKSAIDQPDPRALAEEMVAEAFNLLGDVAPEADACLRAGLLLTKATLSSWRLDPEAYYRLAALQEKGCAGGTNIYPAGKWYRIAACI